ncbi:MAG: acyltransferase family protein [Acidimicrobiia bacterium]
MARTLHETARVAESPPTSPEVDAESARSPASESSHRPASQFSYQPALDGIRAFAVGSVLLYHAGQSWMIGGYLGVDAFFVLSGFLITTLLVTEWSSRPRIDLAAFWARRARRLLPALGLVIVGILVYAAVFAAPGEVARIRSDGFATIGYVANWKFVFSGDSYFEHFTQPSPFRHMWSLAIEEQFYLIWPLIVAGVLAVGRSLRVLLAASLAMLVGSAVLMGLLYAPGHDPSRVYYGTDTRAQSLLLGAIAAILVYLHGPIRSRAARLVLRAAALVGAVYTLWLWSHMSERTDGLYRGGFLLAALAVVAVIVSVTQPDRGTIGLALSWFPLRWIGMISYGLYLWHWPVYLTLTTARTGVEGNALLFLRLATTFVLADLSYYLVERPIRRGTLRIPRPALVIPAVAGALVVALVLSTTGGETSVANVARGSVERQAPRRAPTPESSVVPTAPTASRVLLVGDSVAVTLGIGLGNVAAASNGSVEFRNGGTFGCGMLRGGMIRVGGELIDQQLECDDWNQRWVNRIVEFQPNVVVLLTGAWDLLDREIDGRQYSPGSVGFDRYFLSELGEATRLLASQGANIVVLTTPFFSRPELVGGSESFPEYEPWRVDRVNALLRDYVVAHPSAYELIDLNRYVSPGGRFAEYLRGVRIRDDGVHFTVEGAGMVAAWLVPQLERVAHEPSVEQTDVVEHYDRRKTRGT